MDTWPSTYRRVDIILREIKACQGLDPWQAFYHLRARNLALTCFLDLTFSPKPRIIETKDTHNFFFWIPLRPEWK